MRFSTTFFWLLLALLPGAPSWATPRDAQASLHKTALYRSEQGITPTLNLFPNPSRGQLTVQVTGQLGQEYKLRLSNVLGREVRLLPLHPEQAAEGLAIDLTGLPSGLYFYSLLVNDKIVSTKRLTLQAD